jgi:hypothetical protein
MPETQLEASHSPDRGDSDGRDISQLGLGLYVGNYMDHLNSTEKDGRLRLRSVLR